MFDRHKTTAEFGKETIISHIETLREPFYNMVEEDMGDSYLTFAMFFQFYQKNREEAKAAYEAMKEL